MSCKRLQGHEERQLVPIAQLIYLLPNNVLLFLLLYDRFLRVVSLHLLLLGRYER